MTDFVGVWSDGVLPGRVRRSFEELKGFVPEVLQLVRGQQPARSSLNAAEIKMVFK